MMLKIKRVPTVVSNYQKEEAEGSTRRNDGCGKNCLRECCIQGAKLPLYAFKRVNNIGSGMNVLENENKGLQLLFLTHFFLGR
ncbi:hypothetical protein SLA2020_342950 [Shorea laevis]